MIKRPELQWLLAVLLLLSAAMAINVTHAAELQADYNHAVDGDTANLDIYLTDSLIQRGNVRLAGVDTPDIRGKCPQEKWLAIAAKAYLDHALSAAGTITVEPVAWSDKYGRPVMAIMADGEKVSEKLIRAGMGRAYDGGRREGWCDI